MTSLANRARKVLRDNPRTLTALAAGAALSAAAFANHQAAMEAERASPPSGRFVTVDGVPVHYLEAGEGPPVLLLHGNGAMAEDFRISGLFQRLARTHRVIAPDRPGFGYTPRPRDRIWMPGAQAALMTGLLDRIEVEHPVVLGHSWGTMVAMAMALADQESGYPSLIQRLVLVSGFYFVEARADVVLMSPPALPILGDVMRYTVSPVAGRLLFPAMARKIFQPLPVPHRFHKLFPKALALRPGQLRASAEDTAMMLPAAALMQDRYEGLTLPITIITGDGDKIVTPETQSLRLHEAMPRSTLRLVGGGGHMVHYAAVDLIAQAVEGTL